MGNNTQKISILVTGTNRGLGKCLALQLLKLFPNANFLFTTRSSPEQARKECSEFFTHFENRNITMKSLDLTSEESITKFFNQVHSEKWEFDTVVNNAAMGFDFGQKIPEPKWAKTLMQSNIFGTIKMTNLIIPNLKQNGRIVNVSSELGGLRFHHKEAIEQFTNPNVTEEEIFKTAEEYIHGCERGDLGKWFKSVYGTSKMLLNAWSRFVVKRKLKPGQVSIVMSPGHCETDMGGKGAPNTAESGADTIYQCMMLEKPSFDIFYHRGVPYDFMMCGPEFQLS